MKSKAKNISYQRDPGGLTRRYQSAMVKNSRNGRVVKKLTSASTRTDYTAQKFSGQGTQIKRVFKNGALVKEKTKNLSTRKLINL